MATALDGLLWLFRENPDLLPPYLGHNPALDIEHRRHNEAHPCAQCGQDARIALIAEPPNAQRRWLDLCPECNSLLYKEPAS
jgi:hypothetical protein